MNPNRVNDFDELFDPQVRLLLDQLADDRISVPEGLEDRILSAIKVPQLTVAGFLNDFVSERPSRRRILFNRFVDFAATAAAVILIGSAILLSSGYVRQQARKALCAENLGILGSAVSSYANDYYNQLPHAPGTAGVAWFDPASNQPRRAHLFLLVKGNYIAPRYLICPEDSAGSLSLPVKDWSSLTDFPAGAIISYSFQNLNGDVKFGPRRLQMRWAQAPNMAIMADRTPLLSKNQLQTVIDFGKVFSPNHSGLRGQNILVLDGRVAWQKTPFFGPQRDNIWQAGTIRHYSGQEIPADSVDSFLAP